jgi:hypothetical protein
MEFFGQVTVPGASASIYLYYINNPPSGSHNLVVSATASPFIYGIYEYYKGVYPGASLNAGTSTQNTGSSISRTFTTGADYSLALEYIFMSSEPITATGATNRQAFQGGQVGMMIADNGTPVTPIGSVTIGGTTGVSGNNAIIAFSIRSDPDFPTVTTQAVSSVAATTATGNGNITVAGGPSLDERGIVYSTSSHGDPGNTAPGSSSYSGLSNETGTFTTGAFTESLTGLISRTTYYARAYAHTAAGYAYGTEVSFTTIGFTNPGNVYTSDNTYATLAAVSGDLKCEVSKDAGVTWSAPLTKTFTGSDSLLSYGNASTELWGMSFTRADMVDANFRVRLSQGNISQVYKTFGFTTGTDILTGVEVAVEANYNAPTISIDLLKVKIYYGTSVLPVQAGSQAFASNGRKTGEGAGSGTGTPVYFDGVAWRRTADDTTVVA